jgi:hypothetical protein
MGCYSSKPAGTQRPQGSIFHGNGSTVSFAGHSTIPTICRHLTLQHQIPQHWQQQQQQHSNDSTAGALSQPCILIVVQQ